MAPQESDTVRLEMKFQLQLPGRTKGVAILAVGLLPEHHALLSAVMDNQVSYWDFKAAAAQPPKPEEDQPQEAKKKSSHSPAPIQAEPLHWKHESWVMALNVHPDGQRVATGGCDRRIKIWQWSEQEPLLDFLAHEEWVRALAFSPDGSQLASAGDDHCVHLWDSTTGKRIASFQGHTDFACALAWTPCGKHLLSSGEDGKIIVWEASEQQMVRSIEFGQIRTYTLDLDLNNVDTGGVYGLSCSPDGKLVAAAGKEFLKVFEIETGKEVLKQKETCFGVAFDPSGRWLAYSQKKIHLWDRITEQVVESLDHTQRGVYSLQFVGPGDRLLSGGQDGTVHLWDLTALDEKVSSTAAAEEGKS